MKDGLIPTGSKKGFDLLKVVSMQYNRPLGQGGSPNPHYLPMTPGVHDP